MTVFTYQYWHCPICLVLSIWCLQRTTPLQQLMTLSRVTWIFWVHIYKLLPLQSAPRPCLASCGFDPWHWKCLFLSGQGVSCMIFATQMSWMIGSESYMLWLSIGHLLLILLFSLYWEQEEHRKDITQVDKKEIDLDWRGKLCGDMPNAETILKNKVCVCQGTSGILSHWRPLVFTKKLQNKCKSRRWKKGCNTVLLLLQILCLSLLFAPACGRAPRQWRAWYPCHGAGTHRPCFPCQWQRHCSTWKQGEAVSKKCTTEWWQSLPKYDEYLVKKWAPKHLNHEHNAIFDFLRWQIIFHNFHTPSQLSDTVTHQNLHEKQWKSKAHHGSKK